MQIGNMKLKMTSGLFELVFHIKPLRCTKNDLKKCKDILIHINAHGRRYEPYEQVKAKRAFKYGRIIKHLFKTTENTLSKSAGLSLKSLNQTIFIGIILMN